MSRFRSSVLPFVFVVAALPAQTFIVDANNGPGTHFTDLPQAVGTVPDGAALRVRAGDYSAFRVTGKSLTILADNSNAVVQHPGIYVGSLTPTQRIVLRGLGLRESGFVNRCQVVVENCLGSVHLEQLVGRSTTFPTSVVPRFVVRGSADVHMYQLSSAFNDAAAEISNSCVEIVGCTLGAVNQPTATAAGLAGVSAVDSRLVVFGSTILGGRGGSDFFNIFSQGGAGLEATNSVLDLGPGNVIRGGEGGIDPSGLGCYTIMASGGPGLRLLASRARSDGNSFQGGPGPCLSCSCSVFGASTSIDAFSSLTQTTGTPRTSVVGTAQPGGFVDLNLNGAPNQLALLILGFHPACVSLPTIVDFAGVLALPEFSFGPFVTDALGRASYRLALPINFDLDRLVWAQFVTFPGAVLPGKGSNSVTFVARS